MMNYSIPPAINKARGENNGSTAVPGSFSDAAVHQVAKVTIVLGLATDVLITCFCLARTGTITDGLHMLVKDNGTDITPGASVGGAGDPMMLSQSITEQQSYSISFVVNLAAGTHALEYDVSAAVAAAANNIFDAQISAWY